MTFLFSAFVGSIGLGMVWFASPLAGYLCDRFGCRVTCFLGGTLCIAGLVSTSFVQSLTVMYFTYSALYGLGTCFIYNPCFLVIAKYFTNKLSVATGVVSLGASVGVLYTGPLLQVLLDAFEWRNTFRIMAATYALVCILSLSFNPYVEEVTILETFNTEENNKEEIRNEKTGISLYCSVWSFPAYTVVVTSLTFASFGMYIPYINLVCFSQCKVGGVEKKTKTSQKCLNDPCSVFRRLSICVRCITNAVYATRYRYFHDIHLFQLGFFMFSFKNSTLPSKFTRRMNSQIHTNYNTRNAHSNRLPLCRTNTRLFSIYFQGPKLIYHSLNSVITGSSSSASFKRKLKEFFLSMY